MITYPTVVSSAALSVYGAATFICLKFDTPVPAHVMKRVSE